MKPILCLALLAGIAPACFGQFPIHVDSLYTFIRYNSIWRNTVDWDQVDDTFHREIPTARSLHDTMQCFVKVLEELNDVHSQIYLNQQYYGHYPAFDEATLKHLIPLNDRAVAATNQIRTDWLASRYVYVRVPGMQVFDNGQINAFAQNLHDSIQAYASRKVKGFVIDLRLNTGGNIYPMLSGLSALLGDGVVAYETDIEGRQVRTWEIINGNFTIGEYQTTAISTRQMKDFRKKPVVILTGPVTRSSGSMVAIAFRGRANTYFIGEPTANGYTTSNGFFSFAPNLTLNFATHFVADRTMQRYQSTVNPDLLLPGGDRFDDLSADDKIQAALAWLTGSKRSRK